MLWEVNLFFLGVAFLFFILGILSDKGKIIWFGLSMALFLGLSGVMASSTVTKIVENGENSYSVEVPIKGMRGWSAVCQGMFWVSLFFLFLSIWDLLTSIGRSES